MKNELLKLASCPYCGSDKITIEWEPMPKMDATDTNRRWFAECYKCSCQGPFCQKETQVVEAWNRRTPNPQTEVLKNALEASGRYIKGQYLDWTKAGGVHNCKHGYGEGVPCPACDLDAVQSALASIK
jgi:Lar family restriction alleviation protein